MIKETQKWVRGAQKGSRKDFDRLVRRYTGPIFRLVYDMTGNYEDAQDPTHHTSIKAFSNIKGYRGDAKFSTWLYRIAYNAAIEFLRRAGKKIRDLENGLPRAAVAMDLDSRDLQFDEKEQIQKALQKLTPSQRTAVVLKYYHGMRMKEIGDVLGCSEATARVHLFRGLKHLRSELKAIKPGE